MASQGKRVGPHATPGQEGGGDVTDVSTPLGQGPLSVAPRRPEGHESFVGSDGIAALDRPRGSKPDLSGLSDNNIKNHEDLGEENDYDDDMGGVDGDDLGGGDDEGVCQPGQEQTGRWTRKEHDLFLDALKKYGKVRFHACLLRGVEAFVCITRISLLPLKRTTSQLISYRNLEGMEKGCECCQDSHCGANTHACSKVLSKGVKIRWKCHGGQRLHP